MKIPHYWILLLVFLILSGCSLTEIEKKELSYFTNPKPDLTFSSARTISKQTISVYWEDIRIGLHNVRVPETDISRFNTVVTIAFRNQMYSQPLIEIRPSNNILTKWPKEGLIYDKWGKRLNIFDPEESMLLTQKKLAGFEKVDRVFIKAIIYNIEKILEKGVDESNTFWREKIHSISDNLNSEISSWLPPENKKDVLQVGLHPEQSKKVKIYQHPSPGFSFAYPTNFKKVPVDDVFSLQVFNSRGPSNTPTASASIEKVPASYRLSQAVQDLLATIKKGFPKSTAHKIRSSRLYKDENGREFIDAVMDWTWTDGETRLYTSFVATIIGDKVVSVASTAYNVPLSEIRKITQSLKVQDDKLSIAKTHKPTTAPTGSTSEAGTDKLIKALESAAEFFVRTAITDASKQNLNILNITNSANTKTDDLGAIFEEELYLAIKRQAPEINSKEFKEGEEYEELFLDGTYELDGDTIDLRLSIATTSQLLAAFSGRFKYQKSIEKTPVTSEVKAKAEDTFSDLEISFAGEPASYRNGATPKELKYAFKILNKGNQDSSSLQVTYFLKNRDRKEIIPLSDPTVVKTVKTNKEGISWTKLATLPDRLRSGNYQLIAQIILDDPSKEKNEENNRLESVDNLIRIQQSAPKKLVVKGISPGINASNIPLSTEVKTRFSAEINPQTVNPNTYFVEKDGESIEGRLQVLNRNILFTADKPFEPSSTYFVVISDTIEDIDGNRLKKKLKWQFKTKKSAR